MNKDITTLKCELRGAEHELSNAKYDLEHAEKMTKTAILTTRQIKLCKEDIEIKRREVLRCHIKVSNIRDEIARYENEAAVGAIKSVGFLAKCLARPFDDVIASVEFISKNIPIMKIN